MEVLRCVCVLVSILSSISAADVCPALVWGSHENENRGHHPALEKITPDEFYHHIKMMTGHGQKSLIVAFLEENLSLEDFSWHDTENKIAFPHLQASSGSARFKNFFTSVHAPVKGLRNFQKDGYDIHHVDLRKQKFELAKISLHGKKTILVLKLDDARTDEDRPNFLRRHDAMIGEMYSDFVKKGYQVTAIYTGYHSSWIEPEIPSRRLRVRRLLAEDSNITVPGTLWQSNDSSLLLYSKSVPYIERDGVRLLNLSGTPEVWSVVNASVQEVLVSFPGSVNLSLQFSLTGGYWLVNPITLQTASEVSLLKTYPEIEVPLHFSYHCSQDVVFSNTAGNISLVFESFQVQPFLEELSFGDTYDCVWFFTSVIWSGLFVSLLLGSILAWGLGMLMNIRTMDQFDDPKGPTIQITTTEG